FVVAFDPAGVPHVYSQDNADDHATMTTSTAVGSEFLGSSVGGVAPGARFVSALTGPGRSGVLEALILAARDKRVDIISASLSLETYPSVGNGFSARLIDRLVAHYGKPVVLSAANHGPATSTVLSAGNASSALSVGAYISKRSLLLNLGWRVNREDNV